MAQQGRARRDNMQAGPVCAPLVFLCFSRALRPALRPALCGCTMDAGVKSVRQQAAGRSCCCCGGEHRSGSRGGGGGGGSSRGAGSAVVPHCMHCYTSPQHRQDSRGAAGRQERLHGMLGGGADLPHLVALRTRTRHSACNALQLPGGHSGRHWRCGKPCREAQLALKRRVKGCIRSAECVCMRECANRAMGPGPHAGAGRRRGGLLQGESPKKEGGPARAHFDCASPVTVAQQHSHRNCRL